MKTRIMIGIVLGCTVLNHAQITQAADKVMDRYYEKIEWNQILEDRQDEILCPAFKDNGGF